MQMAFKLLDKLPMVLKSEPNSFFCTTNTPLVTEVFKEFLTDSYVDQKDEKCDKARRVCQLCMIRSCGIKHIDWNMRRTSSEFGDQNAVRLITVLAPKNYQAVKSDVHLHMGKDQWRFGDKIQIQVAVKSHATPHPIVYATLVENVIRWIVICKIKANFAFVRSTYKKTRIDFGIDFTTLGKNQDPEHSTRANSFHSNSYKLQILLQIIPEKIHNFLRDHFVFHFKENIPDVEVAILIKNTPTGAINSEYFLVDLQRRGTSLPNNTSIKLFRQREEKYVTFQNIKPFQFNTENWHKHGCAVDMSIGIAQEQVVENATEKVPVTVRIIPPRRQGAPFSYIIREKDRKVQLRLSAKDVAGEKYGTVEAEQTNEAACTDGAVINYIGMKGGQFNYQPLVLSVAPVLKKTTSIRLMPFRIVDFTTAEENTSDKLIRSHRSLMNAIFCDSSHLTMSPQLIHHLKRDSRHDFKFSVIRLEQLNAVRSRKFFRIWLTLNDTFAVSYLLELPAKLISVR
ncbi:hypothetical protein ACTXT7_002285 [Hymenolepis weldensis]